MNAIIVYGSLINKDQLAKESLQLGEAWPVSVHGYKRIFNQEPSWRKGHDQRRAVLNVVPSDQHYFNGLLVWVRDESNFQDLDERERGYNRVGLEWSRLEEYPGFSFPGEQESIYIYTGKPEKRSDDLLPNDNYLELCLNGAKQWGEKFYEVFLQTTYVGGMLLKAFLENERQMQL